MRRNIESQNAILFSPQAGTTEKCPDLTTPRGRGGNMFGTLPQCDNAGGNCLCKVSLSYNDNQAHAVCFHPRKPYACLGDTAVSDMLCSLSVSVSLSSSVAQQGLVVRFLTEPKLQSLYNKVFELELEFEFSLSLLKSITHAYTHTHARTHAHTHTHTHTRLCLRVSHLKYMYTEEEEKKGFLFCML